MGWAVKEIRGLFSFYSKDVSAFNLSNECKWQSIIHVCRHLSFSFNVLCTIVKNLTTNSISKVHANQKEKMKLHGFDKQPKTHLVLLIWNFT